MFGETMFDFIFFVVFISFFFILITDNILMRRKLHKTKAEAVQTYINMSIVVDDLKQKLEDKTTTPIDKSEGFIKFISDSREMAFKYIERVQESVNKFINDIEPEIDYFDEYGIVGDAYPHYYSMKKISQAYKELKELLPSDYGKIDE